MKRWKPIKIRTGMTAAAAVECLRRMYHRNMDWKDPFFETLTAVQSEALRLVLAKQGMRVSPPFQRQDIGQEPLADEAA